MYTDPSVRDIHWATYNQTVINPVALTLVIIMCLAVLFVKREYIIIPFVIVACFITAMQRIVILNLDFNMLRIMVGFGILRLIMRSDIRSFKFNTIDKLMIYWTISRSITHGILWSSTDEFIQGIGFLIDFLGVYMIIRMSLYDIDDYNHIIKTLSIVSIFIAVVMINEHLTGRNLFSILGGVPEHTLIREGRLRAQGAFDHPIMAGTFGASLIPLMWAMWWKKQRLYSIIGIIGATIITIASASSGPVLTYMCCIFGLYLWKFRGKIKILVYLTMMMLTVLHMIMKAPVWHLISRIDIAGGSTGYHRFMLIDQAIKRFSEWFMVGTRTPELWGWGLQDLTNQYVFEAVYGGFIPLVLFLLILYHCFKTIGIIRLKIKDNPGMQKYIWAMGALLFAHSISFIGVSYFGQMIFFFSLILAMISSLKNLPSIVNIDNNDNFDKNKVLKRKAKQNTVTAPQHTATS